MRQAIVHVALIVRDYDEAIRFFTEETLGPCCTTWLREPQTAPGKSDDNRMVERGIEFVREPRIESYGTVTVFKDLYGNLWDLVEFSRT